jgi:hypothetical protein
VASSFKVQSESGEAYQIKTISSHCTLVDDDSGESPLVSVNSRRISNDQIEYRAVYADGTSSWVTARAFIDLDGAMTLAWLSFVSEDDLKSAISSFTLAQLRVRFLFRVLRLSHYGLFLTFP